MTSHRFGNTAMRLPVTCVLVSLCIGFVGCGSSPDDEAVAAGPDVTGPTVEVQALPAATSNDPRTLPITVIVQDASGVSAVRASVNPLYAQGSGNIDLTSTDGMNWTGSVVLKGNATLTAIPVTVAVVGTDSLGNNATASGDTSIPAAVPPPAIP